MPRILEATFQNIRFEALLYKADGDRQNPLLFCLPGGGSGRGFFDLTSTHSFAKLMNGLGYDVLTMDHPGTASNPLPENHPFLTPRQSADYINWTLEKWVKNSRIIGIGHSMGGMMATLVQGRHTPFQAMALLGSSAGGLDWGLTAEEQAYKNKPDEIERDLEKLTLAKFETFFPGSPGGGPSGKSIIFGAENPVLLEALRQNTCELFAAGGMMSMIRGSFKEEVESLDIPLFFAFGDHDIGIPPKDVPLDYINATSTELITLKNTGHNHMAFSSIYHLCTAMDEWVHSLA